MNIANRFISMADKIEMKDFILSKLIVLYPNDHELYYRMGKLFVGVSKDRELLWYKLCYSIKPDYKDNFCDLCNLLLDLGYSDHIFLLNKDNLFDKFMNEPRFLTVYVRCNLVNNKHENALKSLVDLIKLNSKSPCVTDYDKNEKWRNYHDAGYLFCSNCEIEKSIAYTEKAYQLSLKFNLGLQQKMLSFQNMLCFSDYLYPDHKKIFDKYLDINKLIPDTPLFSFKSRKKNNKIRIGYLSADFVMHSVSNFILPILNNYDRNAFEIVLFALCQEVQPIYNNLGVKIHNVTNLSAKEAAKLINSCNIDILFDLMGYTVMNKLEIFTYHPAPIQITYLGYPNTTGLKSMNYRITDSISDSPLSKQLYSEELIRLPKCFLLYEPIHKFYPNPHKTGNRIVLAAINKENKSNVNLLKTWEIILKKCPNTVILIKLESFDNTEERTKFYMEKLDVGKDRLIVLNKLQNNDYEKVFTMFDILLDPFPYSGTTTTCNCLYNSIPVVTLYNPDYHVHNVSSSLLINSGYPELVANSKEEYIDIVVDLVNHPEKIDEYKRTIQGNFLKLMEPKSFMNGYESELKRVYDNFFSEPKIEKKPEPKIETKPEPKNDNETITITFDDNISNIKTEKNESPKKTYICGCVKNCDQYLDKVFDNIDKIISLFDDYKIVIAYDTLDDDSLKNLNKKKLKYNLELIYVVENQYIKEFTMRPKRISIARKEILNYIRKDNKSDFDYFIMMDMDDVCAGNMDAKVLQYYLDKDNNQDWDSLSFNSQMYQDIWALSIDPYVFSCWHFPGGFDVVLTIANYVSNKLSKLNKNELLECMSAFNGFAIYKKNKFMGSIYDWQIHNSLELFSDEAIRKNENALGKNLTIDTTYHQVIHPLTDCEHRYFHLKAIEKNNAKIRISPLCLFT
jgi:hypothetical protein